MKKKLPKNKDLAIDLPKINKFLRGLTKAEYAYLHHATAFADNVNSLIKNYNLSDEDICERFDIEKHQIKSYTCGAYNYTVSDMARLNAAYIDLERQKHLEEVENNVPVKTP